MGRTTSASKKPNRSTDSSVNTTTPNSNGGAPRLFGKEHECQIQAIWRTAQSQENITSAEQIEKVSNIFEGDILCSYTEAKRIQSTVTVLEQKEEAKFMKERQEKIVT